MCWFKPFHISLFSWFVLVTVQFIHSCTFISHEEKTCMALLEILIITIFNNNSFVNNNNSKTPLTISTITVTRVDLKVWRLLSERSQINGKINNNNNNTFIYIALFLFLTNSALQDIYNLTSHRIINKGCETGPPVYRPYPRRLESLTICRCNYKGSTFSSVI